jgi:hypothetical protein
VGGKVDCDVLDFFFCGDMDFMGVLLLSSSFMCTYILRWQCSVDIGEYYSVAVNEHCIILHVQFYLSIYLSIYL